MARRDLFDDAFASPAEDFNLRFSGHPPLQSMYFRLGSLRLCGGDFLTRWSRERRAARQIAEAVARDARFFPVPYGPSTAAPEGDLRSQVSYLERLEDARQYEPAQPDLLIVPREEKREVEGIVSEVGGSTELPFSGEDDPRLRRLIDLSLLAVARESTAARAESFLESSETHRSSGLAAQRSGPLETALHSPIVLEHEVLDRLASWRYAGEVPIHIWQVFFDAAFGIGLDRAGEEVRSGLVEPTERVFQAPGGACAERPVYEIPLDRGYLLGRMTTEPTMSADRLHDENGQILPYVRLEGGGLELSAEAIDLLSFSGDAADSP